MANTSIQVVDLDFDNIKNSLKNFLRDSDQFKDIDYEASNINMLIELMAVNGYRTGYYQNMVLNESFLDSAILRNSVLSRSKELNYLPISAKSARARVKVTFEADGSSAPYTIPKGSQLTSLVKNDSYTFTIPNLIIVASANSTYEFETDIYEGYFVNDTYTFKAGSDTQLFQVTNRNVDLSSLTVTVFENDNLIGDTYTLSNTLLDLSKDSKVFFLQPAGVGYYEVLFGDGNLGRKPKVNSTIVLNYRVAAGKEANGAREFVLDFDPTGNDELTSSITIDTYQNGIDGADEESIESIKYNAPRHFQTQERAVTASDYKSLLRDKFAEINAINAYGGEELSPPRYGKVYISVDIKDVDGLPDSKKSEYTNYIKNRTTFGIIPEFVEPNYTYIKVISKVRYNVNVTSLPPESIKSLIKNTIVAYRDENLDDFNVIFRQSNLSDEINDSDVSIVSTINDYTVYKKINPTIGVVENHVVDFGTSLRDDLLCEKGDKQPSNILSALRSSNFYYKSELCTFDDDGSGNVRIMKIVGSSHEKITDIGTVNYETGSIRIEDFKVDSYIGSSIRLYIRPKDPDIISTKNNIISIEENEIDITPEQVRV